MDLLSPCCSSAPNVISSSISSIETTTIDYPIFDQKNAHRIYRNKNIVFFGDGTIRSIYCDLSRLLQSGKMLTNLETKKHFGKHPTYTNESIIQSFVKCPIRDRIDCRRFVCKKSSTVLYFIHLGTILNKECPINVQWLREITRDSPIDLVVMSCAYPDLSHRQMEKNNEQFDQKFKLFQSKLSHICSMFKLAFFESIFIWFPPFPSKSLNNQQMNQLEKLIQTCFDIIFEGYQFDYIISPQNWMDYYQQICVKDQCYISNEGVRRLTREISQLVKKKWDARFQMESLNKRFKPDPLV